MSHVETVEASGSAWSYLLAAVLFFALPVATAWLAIHGGPALIAIYRRGRSYRRRHRAARHRAARHRRSSLDLTFRSPVR